MCPKTEHLPQDRASKTTLQKKKDRDCPCLLLKKPPNLRTTTSPTTFLKCQLTTALENNCVYGEARDQKSAALIFQGNRLQIHIFQK